MLKISIKSNGLFDVGISPYYYILINWQVDWYIYLPKFWANTSGDWRWILNSKNNEILKISVILKKLKLKLNWIIIKFYLKNIFHIIIIIVLICFFDNIKKKLIKLLFYPRKKKRSFISLSIIIMYDECPFYSVLFRKVSDLPLQNMRMTCLHLSDEFIHWINEYWIKVVQ